MSITITPRGGPLDAANHSIFLGLRHQSDRALFSRALGEQLQRDGYTALIEHNANQSRLAANSGLSASEVGEIFTGLKGGLDGQLAADADLILATDVALGLTGNAKLTDLASGKVAQWLGDQGKDALRAKLLDLALNSGQKAKTETALMDLVAQAKKDGMDYGFFKGTGTFWLS